MIFPTKRRLSLRKLLGFGKQIVQNEIYDSFLHVAALAQHVLRF